MDCSKSMTYQAQRGDELGKFDLAATLTASLAWFMQQQHDAPGLVLFDDAVRVNLPPSTSRVGLQRVLHALESATPSEATDIRGSLHELATQIPRRSVVVLVSDLFLSQDDLRRTIREFRQRRCEVIVMHVLHTEEVTFPFTEQTLFRGLEGGLEIKADGRAIRKAYLDEMAGFLERVRTVCASCGTDYIPIHGTSELTAGLSGYLAARARRLHGRRQ